MTPDIRTPFTERYGIRYPIAAAGMAFVGMSPRLPIAVSAAGAFPSFGVGMLPPAAITANCAAIRQAIGTAALNLNFITVFASDDHIEACERLKPTVVSFTWGHPPRRWIDRLHAADIDVWEQVGSADAARLAIDDGVDLVVAQGIEAGGHNCSSLPTFVLVPEIRHAIGDSLLLAAGGVCSGATLAAALALGADGVWIGTRLVATVEADAHPEYKRRLAVAQGANVTLTHVFGRALPSFNPMNVLRNRVVEEWNGRVADISPDESTQPLIGSMRLMGQQVPLRRFTSFVPVEDTEGDFDELPLLCGQGVGQVRTVDTVEKVISRMVTEAAIVIGRLSDATFTAHPAAPQDQLA